MNCPLKFVVLFRINKMGSRCTATRPWQRRRRRCRQRQFQRTDLAIAIANPSIYQIVSICISIHRVFSRSLFFVEENTIRRIYNWNPVDMLPMAYYYIKWCDQIVISIEMVRGAMEEEKTSSDKGSILKSVCVCCRKTFTAFQLYVHLKSVFFSRFALLCEPRTSRKCLTYFGHEIPNKIRYKEEWWRETHNILVRKVQDKVHFARWINICYVFSARCRDSYWSERAMLNCCIASCTKRFECNKINSLSSYSLFCCDNKLVPKPTRTLIPSNNSSIRKNHKRTHRKAHWPGWVCSLAFSFHLRLYKWP